MQRKDYKTHTGWQNSAQKNRLSREFPTKIDWAVRSPQKIDWTVRSRQKIIWTVRSPQKNDDKLNYFASVTSHQITVIKYQR